MMRERALSRLPDAANNDGEFKLAARLWDGDVVLVSGDDAVLLSMTGGRMAEASVVAKDRAAQIRIVGTDEGWAKMLTPHPPAFYQDIMAAATHHGFQFHGAMEDVGPYYPALRRLIELLRAE
jgi:hypothetical protein